MITIFHVSMTLDSVAHICLIFELADESLNSIQLFPILCITLYLQYELDVGIIRIRVNIYACA